MAARDFSKVGADDLMDPLLTQPELQSLGGSEDALRDMLMRERAERLEAQEQAKRLGQKLERLAVELESERRKSAGLRAKLRREPWLS